MTCEATLCPSCNRTYAVQDGACPRCEPAWLQAVPHEVTVRDVLAEIWARVSVEPIAEVLIVLIALYAIMLL